MDLHQQTTRVGRMTAAMRAVAMPTAPRALRVAVVREGCIIEERMFRDRARVKDLADIAETLFDADRDAWVLCVPSGATGHIVTSAGHADIGPLASRIALDGPHGEGARGKIVLGRTTILFQLVVPPPQPSRPQLPLATRRAEIDWALTIIVAFSFLLHFGFIGSIFSDWLDPAIEPEGAVIGLIDMTSKMPVTPIVEDADTSTQANTNTNTSAANTTTTHEHAATAREASDARAAALARTAEDMKMSLLTAFTGAIAVEGALNRSDVPTGDLEKIARDARGAHGTNDELRTTTSGGVTTPGAHRLTELGDATRHEGTTRERVVVGPKFDLSTTIYDPNPIIDIERPIALLRPSFRSCYVRKGLDVDPTMEGKIVIDIAIAPNGDVKDVTKVSGEGLSSAVEQCIIERAHNGSFTAPGGAGTHARVPIVFRQQR